MKNISCDPSLEASCQDGSNEESQYMFSLRNKKNKTCHRDRIAAKLA